MKIERAKNASRNILFGLLSRSFQMIVPFFMRAAMIYFLGVQYLGLDSLFTSVLQVLNLAELGVGVAMVFSMYKPIAEDDHATICALMRLYKIYYRIIGLVIAAIGLSLTPFIPELIHGEVPADIDVSILYLLNLCATVLSYWLFAYKGSILRAYQRNDVISKVTLAASAAKFILQILVLVLFENYYYFVMVSLATQVAINIATAVCSEKLYPQYKPQGKLSKEKTKEVNRKILDLFTAQLGVVVNASVDSIVISANIGLVALAIYNNYYIVMNAVMSFMIVFFDSITAGIGNSLITESKEKNFDDLKKLTFIVSWASVFCSCSLLCLYQPFMELWVGKDLMLSFGYVVMMTVMFYVLALKRVWVVVKDAAGVWHYDRFRPLISAGCNLALNLVLVQYIGIYGVMLSTILAEAFVSAPWLIHNVFKYVIQVEHASYLRNVFKYAVVGVVTCSFCVGLCSLVHLPNLITLMINLLICFVVSSLVQLVFFRRSEEFAASLSLVRRVVERKRA